MMVHDWGILADHFRGCLRGRVERAHPLGPYTTYGVGGPAELALFPADMADLETIATTFFQRALRFDVLGGGSNILVSDGGLRGAVVLTRDLKQVRVKGHELLAGAGADSHDVALAARDADLTGAEFLTRLPGSIGGACYMNARAHGGEVSGVLTRAEVVDPQGLAQIIRLQRSDFTYKRSPFQDTGDTIAGVVLALSPGDPAQIRKRMEHIAQSREEKHELDFPSCGCVFKNDTRFGQSSGQLIEQCGLKGYRQGDVQVSPHHANFVLNLGAATAAQIRQVMEHIRRTVEEETGHSMQYEVQLLGQWKD